VQTRIKRKGKKTGKIALAYRPIEYLALRPTWMIPDDLPPIEENGR
jgi:hypothetical protein